MKTLQVQFKEYIRDEINPLIDNLSQITKDIFNENGSNLKDDEIEQMLKKEILLNINRYFKKTHSQWDSSIKKNMVIKKNTVCYITGIWGYSTDGSITSSFDVETLLKNNSTANEALIILEKKALDVLQNLGCNELRQYYVEDIIINNNKAVFSLGT